MQRLICEACRTPPAASARAGDSCARCRGALQLHTRCPWCTGWAREPMCGACSAELLSPHDFGAARMLVEGGVDRYALPERVRALPRHQHAELSARFDAQWSALRIRIEEARGVDRFLLTRGLASTIEDLLIARIPLAPGVVRDLTAEPRPPFDDIERLRDIADRSPLEPTRVMASIALVHARRATRQDMEAARRALRHADGVFADEAALALGRWWVWSIDRGCADAVRERAAALLSDAELGPWAAVSAARVAVSDDERAQLEPGLRAALASRNQDLRFAAALALGDEAGLIAARSAADDVMRARALRALASVGFDVRRRRSGDRQRRGAGRDPPRPDRAAGPRASRGPARGAGRRRSGPAARSVRLPALAMLRDPRRRRARCAGGLDRPRGLPLAAPVAPARPAGLGDRAGG